MSAPRHHVVVGVLLRSADDCVLVARRAAHLHQGGLWEFPGGKVEAGESALAALGRELREELGIAVQAARPFLQLAHDYADRRVLLDVWLVDEYIGVPHGSEGQTVRWVALAALSELPFPAANRPVIEQLQGRKPR